MAKRGDLARESVKNTIIEAFSKDGNYVDFQNKKIYVQARDGQGGEIIQFSITIAMPKVPVTTMVNPNDWTGDVTGVVGISSGPLASEQSTEISSEDKAKIEELKKALGVE